ncbi:RNA polymerase sigma factor [Sphingobacterium mizutaii]|uniref:RNA polymerase sigma factor n=1 Tax=Sphingobacterium mizutaii TaxID=1010 RepID=UPI00289F06B5|nr:sigma-70 family RNA polymerase sigma factor [Sphingobacterium mizutaii]
MSTRTLSKQKNLSDEDLLKLYLLDGDLNHLGDLYQKHSEMVYYVCLRYFKETERSKDAVMQIFEELIDKVKKQDIQDFPRWLYVVSKNHCLMALRSAKNKQEIVTDNFVEFSMNLHQEENYQEREEQLLRLESCLDTLIEKQKKSIQLFFIEQKCYKEVVEITGFSMNDVKSYIQNGKRNLKNCMERNSHE